MSAAGTVELLARGLADALDPLQRTLAPTEVRSLLAELGLEFPPELVSQPGFANALAGARAAAGDLAPPAKQLSQAVQADDLPGIAAAGAALIGRIGTLLDRLQSLGNELGLLSNAFPGIPPAKVASFAASLPTRLVELLVVEHLESTVTNLTNILAVIGLIERHRAPADPADPTRPPFETKGLRLDRLAPLLQSPAAYAQSLYGWGGPGFDGQALFEQLAELADHSGLPSLLTPPAGPGASPTLDLLILTLQVDLTANPRGLRIDLRVPAKGNFHLDVPLAQPGWRFAIDSDPPLGAGLVAWVAPPTTVSLVPAAGPLTGKLEARVSGGPVAPETQLVVFGLAGGTRLEATSIVARAAATLQWDGGAGVARTQPALEVSITGGRFVLALGRGDSLLGALIPKDAVRAELDLTAGVAEGRLYLRGSTGLRATFPVSLSLGPVELQTITVGLAPGAGRAIPIELSATVKTTLGPLTMLLDRIGLTAALDFPSNGRGNIGPVDLALRFRPPAGIGLNLDAGPVSGGGFMAVDPAGGRYAGVLQLKLTFVQVTAFGIYEVAKSGQVSFVAVLGVRLQPGIQLGFGFALSGVGGLVGLNRQSRPDVLRERLASGAAGNVLFCDDPVKNAPTLLGDLGAFFPSAPSGFLVGPTLQIAWLGSIVRFDIGVIIEFPGPTRILILGSVRAMIGIDESLALLRLRMDFFGSIDFQQRLLAFDAHLVNSYALGVFHLTGGTALRLGYGGHPYIVLTMGGFHRRFNPGPLNLPALARIGASLDASFVARVYLRLEMYLAFTSNTLQLGAHAEAGMELGPLSAEGHFDFDALVQFRPFKFDADFSAGFSVRAFGISFASVDVEGSISGPGPLVVHAEASVRRFGVKVSGSATFEIGEHNGDRPTPIPSAVKALEPELSNVANLRAEGGDAGVVLRPGRPAVAGALVSPKGGLVWEQKRAPLKTIIQRFEGVPLEGLVHELRVSPPAGWTASDQQDWFSPGTFAVLDLKASETLNNATFQELPAGLRLGAAADVTAPTVVPYTATIDLFKRPQLIRITNVTVASYMTAALTATLRERTTTPTVEPGKAKVGVGAERFDVYDGSGAAVEMDQAPFQAFQISRQSSGRVAVPSADVTVAL